MIMGNNFIDEVCDNMHGIEYKYDLLARMDQDCKYYLQHPHEKHLWAGNVEEHIEDMKNYITVFRMRENPNGSVWKKLKHMKRK